MLSSHFGKLNPLRGHTGAGRQAEKPAVVVRSASRTRVGQRLGGRSVNEVHCVGEGEGEGTGQAAAAAAARSQLVLRRLAAAARASCWSSGRERRRREGASLRRGSRMEWKRARSMERRERTSSTTTATNTGELQVGDAAADRRPNRGRRLGCARRPRRRRRPRAGASPAGAAQLAVGGRTRGRGRRRRASADPIAEGSRVPRDHRASRDFFLRGRRHPRVDHHGGELPSPPFVFALRAS